MMPAWFWLTAAAVVVMLIGWWILKLRQRELADFRRDLRPGYLCRFTGDDGIEYDGTVIAAGVYVVVVKYEHGTIQIDREDVYPW